MNYEAYKNTLPYPRREDFSTKFWYRKGKLIAKKLPNQTIEIVDEAEKAKTDLERLGDYISGAPHGLKDCITETAIDEESMRVARAAYCAEDARLTELFRQDFFKELDIEDHPKRDALYHKAYEHGHSGGFSEIMNSGWDLVDLIKD